MMKSPSPSKSSTAHEVKPRLTVEAVIKIFSLRPMRADDNTFVPSTRFCRKLSLRFNICDRSIRDIWNRRSWQSVTRPHWNQAEIAADPTTRHTLDVNVQVVPAKSRAQGRPHGAKDTIPRHRRRSVASLEASGTPSPAQVEQGCEVDMSCAHDGDDFEHETACETPQQEWQASPEKIEELSRKGIALEADLFSQLGFAEFSDPFASELSWFLR